MYQWGGGGGQSKHLNYGLNTTGKSKEGGFSFRLDMQETF